MTWTGPSSALLQTGVWAAVAITACWPTPGPLDGHVHRRTPGSPQGRHPEHARPSLPTWPAQTHILPGDSHFRGWGWGLRLMGHGRDSQHVPLQKCLILPA